MRARPEAVGAQVVDTGDMVGRHGRRTVRRPVGAVPGPRAVLRPLEGPPPLGPPHGGDDLRDGGLVAPPRVVAGGRLRRPVAIEDEVVVGLDAVVDGVGEGDAEGPAVEGVLGGGRLLNGAPSD